MIFGIIMLALVVAVAMFHYVQGFFSAMLSATLALFAAFVALAWYEPVAEGLFIAHFPNVAHPVALVGLFAITYVALRLITDKLIGGNIRVPVLADKIGAGVFGAFAGIFSVGILAIAAQMLPFGPSIGGYSRFAVDDREVYSIRVTGRYQAQDYAVYDELQVDELDPDRASGMFPLPVDKMTAGLMSVVSSGSLAGSQSFSDVHPRMFDELFAQRIGTPVGGDRVVYGDSALRAASAYLLAPGMVPEQDFERADIRGDRAVMAPQPQEGVVRVAVRAAATPQGKGGVMNFGMGNVRLVVDGEQSFPIGTLQREDRLLLTRPDDPLFAQPGKLIDFVFLVDATNLERAADGQVKFPAGSFLEFKRAARANLGGMTIAQQAPLSRSADVGVMEKSQASNQR